MYDENTFKNYIFWLKVKRVFFMLVFSIVGAIVGIVISQLLIDVLLVVSSGMKPVIIAISTILFFAISLMVTAGTGKEVQEGYWKMAVLRKLTVISKKLDYLENLDTISNENAQIVKTVAHEINKEIPKANLQPEPLPQEPPTQPKAVVESEVQEPIKEKKKAPKKEIKINKTRISKKS